MILLLIFILGICVGSFLNVLADRLSRDESTIKGRSYCESCKKQLKWIDLIPLFSFVFLKGKCRYCRTPLSYYYPVVELVTGVVFVIAVKEIFHFPFSIFHFIELFYYLFIISSLIVIFFADLKYGIIPDKVLIPLTGFSFIYILLTTYYLLLPSVLAGLGALFFFLLLFVITKGRGMGFGDVKFAFFMGLFLGFPKIIVGLYVAFLTGALVSIILVVGGRKKIKSTIPFGPFLVAGTLVAMFFGDRLLTMLRFL